MSIKIQINSLEALERLIGGDTEMEIQFRESIIQEFTKKHLKALVTADVMKKTADAVKEEISKEFFEQVKNGWSTSTVFSTKVLAELKQSLSYTARQELIAIVSQVAEEQKTYDTIKAQLQKTTDWIEQQLGHEHLEQRLEKMVDARLKAKLGIS